MKKDTTEPTGLQQAMASVDAGESPFPADASTDFDEPAPFPLPSRIKSVAPLDEPIEPSVRPSLFGGAPVSSNDPPIKYEKPVPFTPDIDAVALEALQRDLFPDSNPKTRFGMSKPSTAAIPPIAILELGGVMANGAAKYGRFNWREHAVTTSVYTDAIDRHLLAYRDGEAVDRESGLPHLAHVMACCSILLDAGSIGRLNDDRSNGMAPQWLADKGKA